MTVDGKVVETVYGPYSAADGKFNYAGLPGGLGPGDHSYAIFATDHMGVPSQQTGVFQVTLPGGTIQPGPEITNVVTGHLQDPSNPYITWSMTDTNGIAWPAMEVDGKIVEPVYGPYNGVNYAYVFGHLEAGTHTYVIHATDANASKCYSGAFTVDKEPMISNVVQAQNVPSNGWTNDANPTFTWRAADLDAISETKLELMSVASGQTLAVGGVVGGDYWGHIWGPYGSKYDANWCARLGPADFLNGGDYHIKISAIDGVGNIAYPYTGDPNEPAFTLNGPMFSNVVTPVSVTSPVITWSLDDWLVGTGIRTNSVFSSITVTVDGTKVWNVSQSPNPYHQPLGTLSTGQHTYVIRAKDDQGITRQCSGTFDLVQAGTAAVFERMGSLDGTEYNTSAKVDWLFDPNELMVA